jgi:hypothetical protein
MVSDVNHRLGAVGDRLMRWQSAAQYRGCAIGETHAAG